MLGYNSDDCAKSVAYTFQFIYLVGYIVWKTNWKFEGNNNVGSNDALISKIGSSGNKIWIRSFRSIKSDESLSFTTDLNRNEYVAGYGGRNIDGKIINCSDDGFIRKCAMDKTDS